jgi:hypothetical protein
VSARLARTLAVLAVVVVAGAAGSGSHHLWDLTEAGTLTLAPQTRAVLDDLTTDVEVTAFLRRDEPGRVEAATLLDRYRKANRRVDWRLVDPDESPGEVARVGLDPLVGGVALEADGAVELAAAVTEQDLTAALARIVRGRDDVVCVTTGHGEPALVGATTRLETAGFRVLVHDLLVEPTVPDPCTAVVLAGPTAPLGDAATEALRAWLAEDGKLLVLSDPAAAPDLDLDRILAPLGLGIDRGLVFEGDEAAVVGGDVTAPVVRTYSASHPIVRRLAPTFLPGVQGVHVDDDAASRVQGLTVSRLADTSPISYLETGSAATSFDEADDLPGPITVAAAADRSSNDGSEIRRTRAVVVGDVDFATDAFVGEAANATLFVRSVEWLTLGADLVALSPNLPPERPLRLTDARLTYARLLLAGVVPAGFALAGAMVWAARRHR